MLNAATCGRTTYWGHPYIITSTEGRSGYSAKHLRIVTTIAVGDSDYTAERHGGIIKTLLVMKLTVFFLVAGMLNVAAKGVSQTVTFSGENVPLKTVFSVVEKQTGFTFFYKQGLLQAARPVTIHATETSLSDFLDLVLSQQQLTYSIKSKNIILRRKLQAGHLSIPMLEPPPIKISGTVVDINNQPLAGATIRVKGKNITTTSNEAGFFEINSEEGSTIIVSYVGFRTREFKVINAEPVIIGLEQANNGLDTAEIIFKGNTGYQEIPKERATGSFAQVNNKLFNRQVSTDVLSRLDGLIPGVLFNKRGSSDQNFSIRGVTSINSSVKPLIILDNFPYEGDINNINPADVENINFLMDAAAASIWGARAGNGVLVITTKKAKYKQPFRLSFTSNFTQIEKPDLWFIPRMTSSEYIDAEMFLFEKGAFNSYRNNSVRSVLTPVVETLFRIKEGTLDATEGMAMIDQYRNYDIRNDYDKYLYRKGFNTQNAVSLTGSGDQLSYLISIGWDKNLQQLRGNSYDRITVRSVNTFRPIRKLEIQAGIIYTTSTTRTDNEGPVNGLGSGKMVYPYARLADDNGVPLALEQTYYTGYKDTAGAGKLLNWSYNQLEDIKTNDHAAVLRHIVLNTGVKYELLPVLNAEMKYQYENQVINDRQYRSIQNYYVRNEINQFTTFSNGNIIYNMPRGGILDRTLNTLQSYSLRGQLNFSHIVNGRHSIHALAGGELRNGVTDMAIERAYGYDNELMTSSQVDYVNSFPNYVTGSLSNVPFYDEYSKTTNRFVSAFLNTGYSYKNRYHLSFSARRDASNLFGVSTNNKWKPLWSAGVKWDVHQELFYNWPILSKLSLRATYGHSGNVNNGFPGVVTISYYSSLSQLGRQTQASFQNSSNPSLKWENLAQTNLAIDFAGFNQRLSGTIEYFNKKSTDLIAMVQTDPTIGMPSVSRNSASVRNTGWDLTLESKNIQGEFSWQSSLLLSKIKNKVLTLYPGGRTAPALSVGSGVFVTPPDERFPLYGVYSLPFAGLDPQTGDPMGYIDGKPSKDYATLTNPGSVNDILYHGSLTPELYGTLRNAFSWKNISLSLIISGKFNYYFRKTSIRYDGPFSYRGDIGYGDYARRWQKPGDELHTNIPSLIYPVVLSRESFFAASSANIVKGDHVRLQDVNLSYSLLRSQHSRLPFQQLNLTLYMSNLNIIFWKANDVGLDPLYYISAPRPRTLSLGLNVNF